MKTTTTEEEEEEEEETIPVFHHHYGSFFCDCFRGNKNLSFLLLSKSSFTARDAKRNSYLNLGGLEAGDGRDLLSSSKHDVYVDVFYLKS